MSASSITSLGNFFYASAITFLVYDILLKLDDEIDLIWRSAWSFPKAIYIISRYYHLGYLSFLFKWINSAHASSISTCKRDQYYSSYGGIMIMSSIINLIFAFRISALYGHSRIIIIFLSIIFAAVFVVRLALTIMSNQVSTTPTPTTLDRCAVVFSGDPQLEITMWAVTISGDLIMLLLTLSRVWQDLPKRGKSSKSSHLRRINNFLPQLGSPVMASVYVDGIIYKFSLIFTNLIFAIIGDVYISSTAGNVFNSTLRPWFIVFYSFTGSRLILNLRRISLENTGLSGASVSAPIQFNNFPTETNRTLATRDAEEYHGDNLSFV